MIPENFDEAADSGLLQPRLVRRCGVWNETQGTCHTPDTYDEERTRYPAMVMWDLGWEQCVCDGHAVCSRVLNALRRLYEAADVYVACQDSATDERCGLVQPITVADGNELIAAQCEALEILQSAENDEETHRGGAIWEICDSCGAKWADDEGGKPADAHDFPNVLTDARAFLHSLQNSTG